MRLLLKLKCRGNFSYDPSYYAKVQGFIYKSIQPIYPQLHDLPGSKFFCFSNIYPVGINNGVLSSFKEGETKYLLVSSPDSVFIKALREMIPETVNIGEYSFDVIEKKMIDPKIKKGDILRAKTPIVIRIPKHRYGEYGIKSEKGYVYWRPEYDFRAFVKQIEDNLIKKYKAFYGEEIERESIFEIYKYGKSVSVPLVINGRKVQIIGSLWDFSFSYLTPSQRRLLNLSLSTGLGEKNSLGFGFVNLERNF